MFFRVFSFCVRRLGHRGWARRNPWKRSQQFKIAKHARHRLPQNSKANRFERPSSIETFGSQPGTVTPVSFSGCKAGNRRHSTLGYRIPVEIRNAHTVSLRSDSMLRQLNCKRWIVLQRLFRRRSDHSPLPQCAGSVGSVL